MRRSQTEPTLSSARHVCPHLRVELALWQSGLRMVAGVDEAGMGPLAGPVVAAAVIFPPVASQDEAQNVFPAGVRDSKTLTRRAREQLETAIRRVALGVGIGVVDVAEIDQLNIYHAGRKAMCLAISQLPEVSEHVLIDGRSLPDLPCPQTSFVKGDREIYTIAAASIVAKVYRDRLMAELDREYPGYGFAQHLGYGTPAHRAALRRLGPSPVHRRSFRLL
ncbi:MAG: ribonuclease HII [Candidatus Binatia bacterium]|nr:ribonuclease HII [Candidatus Binatia bacterium]